MKIAGLKDVEIIEPEPGFRLLDPTIKSHTIVKHYKEGLWQVTISLESKRIPTPEEVKMLVQKMDRINNFHSGQAIGFLLATRAQLKKADQFNPASTLDKISANLKLVQENLDSYISKVQKLDPTQVRLELERLPVP